MRVNFDSEADVLHVVLKESAADTSEEVAPGIYLEFDAGGTVVGVEITSANLRGEVQPVERAA